MMTHTGTGQSQDFSRTVLRRRWGRPRWRATGDPGPRVAADVGEGSALPQKKRDTGLSVRNDRRVDRCHPLRRSDAG